MIVKITISSVELNAGPSFDIYENSIGAFALAVAGVGVADLIAGYTLTLPFGTTIARVQSTGGCTDYKDIVIDTSIYPT